MKIKKFILKGYRRLMLTGTEYFEWTPNARIMLLLGSNGSGKSSILEELTPCPAHHSAFETGGFKEFHCVFKSSNYTLRSEYNTGSGLHSFKRDGHELNDGGTFQVQKDLVLSVFGLDRNIHEVLTGVLPFTTMPTAKRREWLTRLSPVDLSYAFNQYNTVTSHKRDAQGVIRHKAKRMGSENIDLPGDAEMSKYREQVKTLSERLLELYRIRGNEPIVQQPKVDHKAEMVRYKALFKEALRDKRDPTKLKDLNSEESAVINLRLTEQSIQKISDDINNLAAELETLSSQRTAVNDISPEMAAAYYSEQATLTEYINKTIINATHGPFPIVEVPYNSNSVKALDVMHSELMEIINTIPNNEGGELSMSTAADNRELLARLKKALSGMQTRYNVITLRLATLKDCKDVECPDCSHSFKPGIDPKEIDTLTIEVNELYGKIEECEKHIETTADYLERFEDYMVFVNRFKRLASVNNDYRVFWNEVSGMRILFNNPRKYATELIGWCAVQTEAIKVGIASSRLEEVNNLIRRYESFDLDSNNYNVRRSQELELQIQRAYDERAFLIIEENGLKWVIANNRAYFKKLDDLENDFKNFLKRTEQEARNQQCLGIDEEIRRISSSVTEIQAKLHRYEMMEHTLRDIEREHTEAIEWHGDLALLEKALSPKEGLIGKYLMGFMQEIVKLMNAVIGEVWTYPLKVLPSKVSKDELDYNFPLDVNNGAVTPPDISRGSSSQRDIVNFAFKLIVMKFMGFDDYPLFLDEFGNTFDEQHRENLNPFLNRLVDTNQISQIIFVSHFSSTHGSFNHAEVVVLDPTNITTPAKYNVNVVLK